MTTTDFLGSVSRVTEKCGAVHPTDNRVCTLRQHTVGAHMAIEGAGALSRTVGEPWTANGEPPAVEERKPPAKGKGADAERMKAKAAGVEPAYVRPTRHEDPPTSHEAAVTTEEELRSTQQEVLALIRSAVVPIGHEEIVEQAALRGIKQSESGIRTRCSELVAMGLLFDSGQRGSTRYGKVTILWTTSPSGETANAAVSNTAEETLAGSTPASGTLQDLG